MKKMQKSVPSSPKTHEKSWIFWSNGISLLETSLQMAILPMSKSDFQISSFSAWGTFSPKFGLSNGTFLQKRKSCIPSMKHFSVTKDLFFQKLFSKNGFILSKKSIKKTVRIAFRNQSRSRYSALRLQNLRFPNNI